MDFINPLLCFVIRTESGRNFHPRWEDDFYNEREHSFSVGEPPKNGINGSVKISGVPTPHKQETLQNLLSTASPTFSEDGMLGPIPKNQKI